MRATHVNLKNKKNKLDYISHVAFHACSFWCSMSMHVYMRIQRSLTRATNTTGLYVKHDKLTELMSLAIPDKLSPKCQM